MKICITSTGNQKNSLVDVRFGRCRYFAIFDDTADKFEFIQNPGMNANQGAGITSAQKVIDMEVDAVITGNVGPNAIRLLKGSNIKIFSLQGEIVKEALESYKEKDLIEITNPGPSHFGMGKGNMHGHRKGWG